MIFKCLKRKKKNMKIKTYLPKLILLGLFILTFIVNLQIGLFGDDYEV